MKRPTRPPDKGAGDLFAAAAAADPSLRPLADRMRPRTLDEIVGQEKILAPGRAIRQLVAKGEIASMILWGPPGSGKTTLARALAAELAADFESVSAVMSGVKELREVVERARAARQYHRKKTVLFIDEIHRFNKAQQDALLPHVETGLVTLIGATTENPSFEVNAALLSRCRVFVLEPIPAGALLELLARALADPERGLGARNLGAAREILEAIAAGSQGDARRALNTLEIAADLATQEKVTTLSIAHVEEATQHKALLYDKAGEEHYNIISAFIKSLRGSDPDAATYWMVRMLESGEEPRFILRRMVIFASEDVGNADPRALGVAVNALHAFELVGLPEGVLPMTQAATYLACAPKSNAVIVAYKDARRDVLEHGPLPVPKKLRNAPTALMKGPGYGRDYKYPHEFDGHYVPERYLPDRLADTTYYRPSGEGDEQAIKARLDSWRAQTARKP
ncbi:MAG: replication-associated recombination protein A [Deltaproteobacteria bacterium]|nr:replication-associated recombination protein A [Deltaproteobacteria bacterium]